MPLSPDSVSMAMFCDFENVALGVRDAKYDKFDIKPVLERLLLKGSIVVKKAYCDWERYKGFKAAMHEANFELIEIPHVRQSGKNSADIRMVVDALDLCYTKAHVNAFVIVSGDSDFSPLVSKLRENAKYVIGVGIKQSTSDLLIANCDEFIFYDDLVRESQRSAARRNPKAETPFARRSPEELEARRSEALELAVSTFDALVVERGDSSKIWASMLKEAVKRRRPDFNESHFGFRAFGNLLDEAQARGLFEVGRDEKSGAYVFRGTASAVAPVSGEPGGQEIAGGQEDGGGRRGRRGGRGKARVTPAVSADSTPKRTRSGVTASAADAPAPVVIAERTSATVAPVAETPLVSESTLSSESPVTARPTPRRGRGKTAKAGANSGSGEIADAGAVSSVEGRAGAEPSAAPADSSESGRAKKAAPRRTRSRKPSPAGGESA